MTFQFESISDFLQWVATVFMYGSLMVSVSLQ